jgi:hypothetical protein
MKSGQRNLALIAVLAILTSATALIAADKHKPKKNSTAVPQMDESKRALHALNRLTFGPRPGDLQRVEAMGVDNWIELQLHPEKIADSALATQGNFATLETLKFSADYCRDKTNLSCY